MFPPRGLLGLDYAFCRYSCGYRLQLRTRFARLPSLRYVDLILRVYTTLLITCTVTRWLNVCAACPVARCVLFTDSDSRLRFTRLRDFVTLLITAFVCYHVYLLDYVYVPFALRCLRLCYVWLLDCS